MNRTHGGPSEAGVRRELGIYLNDHLAGATAGAQLAHRVAASAPEPEVREALSKLSTEVAEDRAALLDIMKTLRFPVRRYKPVAGWIAERLGRLKINGHVRRRSPMSTLLELEMLRLAVEGKAAGWRTLRELAELAPGSSRPGSTSCSPAQDARRKCWSSCACWPHEIFVPRVRRTKVDHDVSNP